MSTREAVITEALSWLGTPYHHNAAIKGVGVDCGRIIVEVYSATGMMQRVDLGEYPKDWHLHRDEQRYLDHIRQVAVQVENPKPGDVLLYKFGRTASHSAILIDESTVLHAYFQQGVILAERDAAEFKGRLHSAWSFWKDEA